ncbi:VOC family protein [Amycolatopsis regifaucium]|uniref:Glyoxalase n=1 Tax=Amycolatopsis regifaucium TaxID=546365 RepID=A0A154MHR3_9PSEU|nr:VOC family protein [Amycolatopsis regifaucium]KZB83039.1 glyoxalase [Amycolatopsis regifaucium]OKA03437.1 glyoxalase [Amycolatopsis regifaucium]SFJ70400.1 Catechol-2,3-dioxygenase [Amycolatopsis regifaucium]
MNRPQRIVLREGDAAGTLARTSVSHIGLSVPDIEAAARFYRRVLGMTVHRESPDGRLRLGWGRGHHVLDLVEGARGLRHYGFEVRDPDGIDGISRRLTAAGHPVRELDADELDAAVAPARGLATIDPHGTEVHFHTTVERDGETAADTGRRPIKYQHITLGTDDVEKIVDFYVRVIGFRISDQLDDGRFAWLRSDRDHHTLAVVDVGRGGDIDHYSYDLAEWEDFKSWCDRLTDENVDVTWGPGRHGPGNNLFVFFDDPAGNHVELSAEMEKFHDDRVTYVPRRWKPVPGTVNLWGGQLASWRRTSEGK